jgi:hypothetical protein
MIDTREWGNDWCRTGLPLPTVPVTLSIPMLCTLFLLLMLTRDPENAVARVGILMPDAMGTLSSGVR